VKGFPHGVDYRRQFNLHVFEYASVKANHPPMLDEQAINPDEQALVILDSHPTLDTQEEVELILKGIRL
jgi:hypothetical protein